MIGDASPVGLGAVLVQENIGEQLAVCYASRSLTDCERRYSHTEKVATPGKGSIQGSCWSCTIVALSVDVGLPPSSVTSATSLFVRSVLGNLVCDHGHRKHLVTRAFTDEVMSFSIVVTL